jgi:protein-S-isoprenylcysteine O-methyltransferase Ste14
LGIVWFLVKSLVEERFLRTDPEYSAYMGRVRRRWIPGVL